MSQIIYFDNNATTQISEDVLEEMLPYLKNEFGNPSSTYFLGRKVKDKIIEARENVSRLLGCSLDEVIFTSCASESNQTAIMSAIRNNPNKKHIITSSIEHASIMETMKYLEKVGYNISYLSVDNNGKINLDELESLITEDTLLITMMMANNELGNIYPILEIGKIAKRHKVLFHCDAVQAVGKVKINVKDMNIDTLSLAGHKINAPKGIGVLYVRKGIPFTPLIFGHQELNRRGGTENTAYIIGLGKACKNIIEDDFKSCIYLKELRDYMEREIKANIADVLIYGDLENRTPNTSSIAFKGVKADELLLVLESFNIFVSTGSACNSEEAEPSHVLTACDANLKDYSPIRISLGKNNTKEEVDTFIRILINCVMMLRRKK